MKLLYYLIIAALALLLIIRRKNDARNVNKGADTITITNTVRKIQVDTMYILSPHPYLAWIDDSDTIHVSDTCLHLREYKEYQDSNYYAKVSGVAPRLDEIRVYPKTVTQYVYRDRIVSNKQKRWGIGLSAGYGVGRNGLSPVLALTVNYNLWQF